MSKALWEKLCCCCCDWGWGSFDVVIVLPVVSVLVAPPILPSRIWVIVVVEGAFPSFLSPPLSGGNSPLLLQPDRQLRSPTPTPSSTTVSSWTQSLVPKSSVDVASPPHLMRVLHLLASSPPCPSPGCWTSASASLPPSISTTFNFPSAALSGCESR